MKPESMYLYRKNGGDIYVFNENEWIRAPSQYKDRLI